MEIERDIHDDTEAGAKRLFAEYGRRLTAAAFVMCGNEADAQDLVSETVDIAIRQIGSFRKESPLFEWLYGIMQNRYRHSMRRKSATNESPVADLPDTSVEGAVDGAEQIEQAIDAKILRDAIRSLPPELKEAIILNYFEELPIVQIAKFLALPVGTVKSRLYYARVELTRRLGGKLKKPAAALAAALMFLTVSAAALLVRGNAAETPDETYMEEQTLGYAEMPLADLVPALTFVPSVPPAQPEPPASAASSASSESSPQQQGESAMNTNETAAAALAATLAVAPMLTARADGYRFINPDTWPPANVSHSGRSAPAAVETGAMRIRSAADALEARSRARGASSAITLNARKIQYMVISFH